MLLARVLIDSAAFVARVQGDRALPPGDARLPGVVDPPLSDAVDLAGLRFLPPVRPGKVACIGRNYAAHAAELGNSVPPRPLLFLKPPSAVIGAGQPILLPPDSERVEHEAELGVVIGARCRHVQPSDADAVIFGFTCVNDVTARDLQRSDKQFARGKGFDTFCPIGPWVATGLDWRDLRVRCRVDGELRQDGRTAQMVFDVAALVATVSRVMTLEPGDVIATGTPEGVGLLRAGQRVEVEIEGIGVLGNPVAADPDAPGEPPAW